MLKKVFKAIAKLEARAKKSDAAQLSVGTSLSTQLRNAVVDLEGRAQAHDAVAAAARQAAQRLRDQLRIDMPVNPPSKPATPPAVEKPAPRMEKPAPKAKPVHKAVPIKKPAAPPKAVTKAPATPATQSTASPTLAEAIEHVLKTRRDAHAGSVMARQLHAEVQQAGYRFGGNKVENQMNYLHKTLRQNSTRFKRAADGGLSIA